MAKVKIQGHATGSGIITIAAPNTNTNRTLTLPDADVTLGTPEGTAILSTGESGGTKFLREDGDGTCSWQTAGGGGGDLVKIATQSFNGSVASLTFTDCFSSTYESYILTVTDMGNTGQDWSEMHGYFSSDSGSNWLTDYSYLGTTQTKLRLSDGADMGNSTTNYVHTAEYRILGTTNTAHYTSVIGNLSQINRADGVVHGTLRHVRVGLKSKAAVDSFKIQPSNGTAAQGTVTIFGLKS